MNKPPPHTPRSILDTGWKANADCNFHSEIHALYQHCHFYWSFPILMAKWIVGNAGKETRPLSS
jgi:hypothetical protein